MKGILESMLYDLFPLVLQSHTGPLIFAIFIFVRHLDHCMHHWIVIILNTLLERLCGIDEETL